MTYEEIKKLMDDMGDSKLNSLEIKFPDGIKINMTKSSNLDVNTNIVEEVNRETITETSNEFIKETISKTEILDNYKEIKSPMVGTFYITSAPGKPEFVKVGDIVQKGSKLCIIEAMKLMNEIDCEFDGEIIEICVKNEEMVEFGQVLFKIK